MNFSGKFKWLIYVFVIPLAALAIYWVRFAPVKVLGYRVSKGEITAEVMGAGTLEAKVQAIVSSKISGRIADVPADQGDLVKQGQVLVRLDDNELRQQAEIARSAHEAAAASSDRARSDSDRSQAVLDQARVEHGRNARLYENKSISVSEMDKLKMSVKVAEADLASSMARVVEAHKNLMLARNTLDYHLARLDDTVIRAPFSGLIVRRDRDPGDVVVPGTSIFLLVSPEQLWVRAWVDETEMSRLKAGQPARVEFRSEPDRTYDGRVARLGRETDRETRQFIIDVAVNSLPVNWSVGQRADVFIETARKTGALVLPSNLLLRGEKGALGLMAVKQDRAVWHDVRIGLHGRDKVEIVEGLREGDIVIVSKAPKTLTAGTRVEVSGQ
ncbi:MAG: efflux RND transporter periplasmic adaptor subunit [Proteobacteria bacterium]|nr:efflux RND transporter periplasmic adaptor subunit [Pseudomonadota bacterium]